MSQSAQKNIDKQSASSSDLHRRISGNRSISAISYLATDYLNHFNEVIMLLDMIVDMPDLIDELLSWQPKTYFEHFKKSALADEALIVEAYFAAEPEDRNALAIITTEMENIIKDTIQASTDNDEPMDEISLVMLCTSTTEKLRERINLASGVINSGAASVAKHHDLSLTHTSINDTQATADILFDQ